MNTAAEEANATAEAADPSVSTAAKPALASAMLVRNQASVSIIARGTIALIAAELRLCRHLRPSASASIVAEVEGARTVLLRPTPHHDVKSRCLTEIEKASLPSAAATLRRKPVFAVKAVHTLRHVCC